MSKLPEFGGPPHARRPEPAAQIGVVGQLQVGSARVGQGGLACLVEPRGRFGRFSVDTDGAWTYSLDRTLPQVQALGPGECMIDDCTVQDTAGRRHVIAVTLLGSAKGLPIRFIGDECCVSTEFDHADEWAQALPKGHDRLRAAASRSGADLAPAVERWRPDPGSPALSLASRVVEG
jgi:VCBS repeat-containing protein